MVCPGTRSWIDQARPPHVGHAPRTVALRPQAGTFGVWPRSMSQSTKARAVRVFLILQAKQVQNTSEPASRTYAITGGPLG